VIFEEVGMRFKAGMIFITISLLLSSGCASMRQSVGQEYNIDNVVLIQQGMSEQEVVKLLGKPYATGKDLDGNIFLQYEHMVTGVISGGAFVHAGRQSISGGKTKIVLEPTARTVKVVQYEIYGTDNYDKLKGVRHVENR
jgi:hypothetical protein